MTAKAWLANERKAYDEAEQLLLDAIARNSGDAVVNGRLGHLYAALGRPREALARFTRAAELDPMYFMYPMYRCLMLQDLGQNDDAARACARMRTLTPNNHWGAFVTSLARELRAAICWKHCVGAPRPRGSSPAMRLRRSTASKSCSR